MACNVGLAFSPGYRTSPSQKLKSKQAAYEKKFGSPKMELLRQKCRIRAKEARSNSHSSGRKLFENRAYIEKTVAESLMELDLKLEAIALEKVLDEATQWFIESMEEEEKYLIECDGQTQPVFCPICMKSVLESPQPGLLVCKCGTSFHFPGSLQDFHRNIQCVVGQHEERCEEPLSFFLEPKEDQIIGLNGFCDRCDSFHPIW